MALPPPHDHRIPLTDASTLARAHRDAAARAVRGGMFHAQAVLDLLAQPGCVGLRYYYGRSGDGTPTLILVGVNADGNDLADGAVLEFSFPCPPYCPTASDLSP